MSKRDTILVGVIANVIILTLLFASAIKHEPPQKVAKAEPIVDVGPLAKSVEPVDQVDEVLDQYAKAEPAPVVVKEPEFVPIVEEKRDWVEVEVASGDMLEKIARKHKTSVDSIIADNQLKTTNLKVGQRLRVTPGKGKVAEAPKKTYTVKAGDSPWTIAIKNHMKVEELLAINGLDEAKAKKLKPGDTLVIR